MNARLLLLAVWLALPGPVFALDGDRLSSSGDATLAAEASNNDRGTATVARFLLCDGDPGASKVCGVGGGAVVFDTQRTGLGNPSRALFSFIRGPSCTGTDTVAPQGSDSDDLTVKWDLGPAGSTTLTTGQQMVVAPIVNRYLTATITDGDSSCTDVEVVLQLFYDKGDTGGR